MRTSTFRRTAIQFIAAYGLLTLASGSFAQNSAASFPSKPIRWVVVAPPGSGPYRVTAVKPGTSVPSEQELIAFCREHMARFKVPKSFTVVDELPRNSMGKIQKRTLRDTFS